MLTLFDRPSAAFYDAYGPLDPGYEARLVIYKLWPALCICGSSAKAIGRWWMGC
jgi:fructosamine-3-kinase